MKRTTKKKTKRNNTSRKRAIIGVAAILALALAVVIGVMGYRHVIARYDLPELPDKRHYAIMSERADAALAFAKRHNMNERYAIFIDYSIPSGKPRMHVWDFKKGKIIASAHVMHGTGGGSTPAKPVFSNRAGSKCSALGRFKVTKEHGKKIQRSFRLRGMDIDNRNAQRRGLMIHASSLVDRNKGQEYLPLDEESCSGCVTVSRKAMNYLYPFIKGERKALLLWSYYE